MKAMCLLLINTLLLTYVPLLRAQNPTAIPSSIQAVTVYRSGALLTHTGTIQLSAGQQVVRFDELSRVVDANSIRLAVDPSVATFALDFSTNYARQATEPDSLLALRDSVGALDVARQELAARQAGYQEELAVLAANRTLSTGASTTVQNPEAILQAAQLFRERTTETKRQLAQLATQLIGIAKARKALEARIASIRPSQAHSVGRVTATLIAERAGSFPFELSYITPEAGWNPAYDLFVDTEAEQRSRLVLTANTFQATGIDWSEVDLTLSTGDIQARLVPPALQPYVLGVSALNSRTPRSRIAKDEADVMMEEIAAPSLNMVGAKRVSTFAAATNTAAARLYTLDRSISLAATGRPAAVKLTAIDFPAELRYRVVPKRDPVAYLEAFVTGWDSFNLMAAQTRMHLDGRYLGETYLNASQSSDTLSFGLGPDPRISVVRTGLGQGSDRQLLRGKRVYQLGYRITLRNTRTVPVKLLVEDQFPLSRREEIQVDLGSVSGKPTVVEESGALSWQLTLKPTTREILQVKYTVSAPKGIPIRFE